MKVLAALLLLPFVLLAGSFSVIELRKAYWDWRVDTLCGVDGGAHIIEKVNITAELADSLVHVGGHVAMVTNELRPTAPAYKEMVDEVLKMHNPMVVRREEIVIRRSDGEKVGSLISYIRSGGDFPISLSPGSLHRCPPNPEYYALQATFFNIEGEE